MIDKFYVEACVDNFNMRLDQVKTEVQKNGEDNGSFDYAVTNLRNASECISALENIVKHMKQESHDLLQDVHNKFKEKNYVKTIKF